MLDLYTREKVEEVQGCNYATREEATRAIVTYIEAFYQLRAAAFINRLPVAAAI